MATALLKCDKFKGDKGKYGTYPVNMLTANLSRVMNSLAWGRQKWQTWPAEHFRSSSLVAVLFANPPRTCCWCQPAETSAPQTVIERDPPCQLSQILDLPKGRSYMTCITHKYTCNTHKYKYINTVYTYIYIHIFQLYFIYYIIVFWSEWDPQENPDGGFFLFGHNLALGFQAATCGSCGQDKAWYR